MKSCSVSTTALAAAAAAATASASTANINSRCTESVFAAAVPDAVIEKVAVVSAGSAYGEGAADLGFPTNPTDLPELCAVTLRINSSSISSYRFGVFLPTEWNSRMLTVGNSAFAGGINWLDMGAGVKYGFAVTSTDTGHNSTVLDGSWAFNNPETQKDFGYRAIHGTVDYTKALVKKYYEDDIAYSYYSGCSTGGRQGMVEVQDHPDSFDGALVGAPAWWTTRLHPYTLKMGLANGETAGDARISYPQFLAIGQSVIEQCDALDGVVDGIVSDPMNCKLNYDLFKCGVSSSPNCLTDAQMVTIKAFYETWVIDGKWTFPGMIPSSEDQWFMLYLGDLPSGLGLDYLRDFYLNNQTWDPSLWEDSMLAGIEAADPGSLVSDNFTGIANFRDKGGKVLMYHGLADGLISPVLSDYLYNTTADSLGEEISSMRDWFRSFHVPGMSHCSGTFANAPNYFAGANQAGSLNTSVHSVPGFEDKSHDALLALMDWVENGNAVDTIIATAWNNVTDPSSGVLRQRPLCPYPETAKLTEGADEKLVSSWTCS
ncbi:hypothetical protein TD95_000164 [Thielaviopsis punctulata]|uniref:Carboxylic ester hydrolase n=1 Tax=Thielaviopsis punctulata TaxID=72032 RepID=A0A0F4Z7H2_9PEZI|nr:hypothetical protein TD95_000164 [Thielaviopsis punctulata]